MCLDGVSGKLLEPLNVLARLVAFVFAAVGREGILGALPVGEVICTAASQSLLKKDGHLLVLVQIRVNCVDMRLHPLDDIFILFVQIHNVVDADADHDAHQYRILIKQIKTPVLQYKTI